MPGIDICQPQVEHALRKAGWQISSTQYYLRYRLLGGRGLYIDLQAIEASSQQAIYVEIKCFGPTASHDEFFRALGQYQMYRAVLLSKGNHAPLYLALLYQTYATFKPVTRRLLVDLAIKLILIDL